MIRFCFVINIFLCFRKEEEFLDFFWTFEGFKYESFLFNWWFTWYIGSYWHEYLLKKKIRIFGGKLTPNDLWEVNQICERAPFFEFKFSPELFFLNFKFKFYHQKKHSTFPQPTFYFSMNTPLLFLYPSVLMQMETVRDSQNTTTTTSQQDQIEVDHSSHSTSTLPSFEPTKKGSRHNRTQKISQLLRIQGISKTSNTKILPTALVPVNINIYPQLIGKNQIQLVQYRAVLLPVVQSQSNKEPSTKRETSTNQVKRISLDSSKQQTPQKTDAPKLKIKKMTPTKLNKRPAKNVLDFRF